MIWPQSSVIPPGHLGAILCHGCTDYRGLCLPVATHSVGPQLIAEEQLIFWVLVDGQDSGC